MNTSNGQILIYEGASVQGQDAQKEMDGGQEFLRKRSANKFLEMKDKPVDE